MAFPVIASLLAASLSFSQAGTPAQDQTDDIGHWGFEGEIYPNQPNGWQFNPAVTGIDREEGASGSASLRIVRDDAAERPFDSAGLRIPVSGASGPVVLRAMLRTEGVEEGAFMWIQQRNGQQSVGFTNSQHAPVTGDTGWELHELTLQGAPEATHIILGVGLVGAGAVWIDDVDVLVDGISQRPGRNIHSLDREFDDRSGIDLDALDSLQIGNLGTLAKVWGFLKYHHPAVTAGEHHWDFELFRVMPAVLEADSVSEAHRRIADWIEALGAIVPCTPCAQAARDAHLNAEIDWIYDETRLGSDLSDRLREVYLNRPTGMDQFYRGQIQQHTVAHSNELGYSGQSYPDAGYRLLAVIRYWNIVAYGFPYRDQIDRDWDEVLADYLRDVVRAGDELAYQRVLLRMIGEIGDSHANLVGHYQRIPPAGPCDIPAGLRFVEDQLVVAGFKDARLAEPSGLQVGDVIRSIDGEPVADLIDRRRALYSASNEWSRRNSMAHLMLRGACGPVALEVSRNGQDMSLEPDRLGGEAANASRSRLSRDRAGETFQWLPDNVGYLKLSSVSLDAVPDYVEQIRQADALVIDIRNYPSAFMVYSLARWFAEDVTPFARFTRPDHDNPGSFVWFDPVPIAPVDHGERLDLPVAVLVDDSSISSAEFTAMAFRALPNMTLVGSPTVGADGDVTAFALPGGVRSMFSGLGVFYPDGGITQRVGIIPDIEVYPTIEGIRAGRDEVLEAALEHLAAARGD